MKTLCEKRARFRALHTGPEILIAPNAWDAGSAKILSKLGFEALASTSAGFAFSRGVRDSCGSLSKEQMLDNLAEIVEATDLPVSGDLENGFGHRPDQVADCIVRAQRVGLSGGAIEDATGNVRDPIYTFNQAVDRIQAAVESKIDPNFMVTARAENFLYGRPDIEDTIRRLQAFESVGADVLYAPGLPDIESVQLVVQSLSAPVNVVLGLVDASYTVQDLAAAGVKRISVGGSFARAALGALVAAALELKECGTAGYTKAALTDAEASAYMRQ